MPASTPGPLMMLQQTIVVPPPPPPPGIPAPPTSDELQREIRQLHAQVAPLADPAHDPAAVLRGLKAQREVLGEQLDNIQRERENVVESIRESRNQGMPVEGLEMNLAELDRRILSIHQQIAVSDNAVALASATPGAIPPPPPPEIQMGPPEEAYILGVVACIFVFLPMIVFRYLSFRKRPVPAPLASEASDRLRAIEQSVETIAVEMERIGEGQRFMSRLITERGGLSALGEGAAKPVELPHRERVQTPVR